MRWYWPRRRKAKSRRHTPPNLGNCAGRRRCGTHWPASLWALRAPLKPRHDANDRRSPHLTRDVAAVARDLEAEEAVSLARQGRRVVD